MANFHLSASSFFHILLLLVASTISVRCDSTNNGDGSRKVYIVYMGAVPSGRNEYFTESNHQNILQDVLEGSLAEEVLVRHYKRSFNGFAAKLTEEEVQKLSGKEGIVSVFPSKNYQLQTTRSWDFMGLAETVKRNPAVESDVVVGLLDSGIWPESESFSDKGFGPAPKKWKGVCKGGTNFTCNNKIIGARDYTDDGTARDKGGHGTHTSSTAAGSVVKGASFYGLAEGTARGAVPSARIAMYKVCDRQGCASEDILAAFDDAIVDGVDVLSVSLGSEDLSVLEKDPIAIGSFHAMENGILTSHSAGNNGPLAHTTTSVAPWMLSVAASSTDRRLIDKVVLGSGMTLEGVAVNSFNLNGTKFPLVYGKEVSTLCNEYSAQACQLECLDKSLVEGKIVVCDAANPAVAFSSGALGVILVNDGSKDFARIPPLPSSTLLDEDAVKLKSYIKSGEHHEANILKTVSVKDSRAPEIVSFSSRGPNSLIPEILKPDISAPGVDILAAFSPLASPSNIVEDTRAVKYSVLSGTSMACPHVTGAAAYVKTFHPEWSPSAIKSALMTTAWVMNNTKNGEGEFAYGAGHIDPVKAVNPGLVYEAGKDDYVKMLCSLGDYEDKIKLITNATCPKGGKGTPMDLNYPSMSASVQRGSSFNFKFPRTVTNVGLKSSTYKASIKLSSNDNNIKISVKPDVLSFKSLGEKKSFVVSAVGKLDSRVSASLIWSDGVNSVRSPIVLYSN